MTILRDVDLTFAKEHLSRFADSDFFPPLYEFEAVWQGWDEFCSEVKKTNVERLSFPTPLQLPAPKPNQTFRIVHQLDPLSCIVYTALAHAVCSDLEAKRIDKSKKISCSYRTKPEGGSFFSEGTGYQDFLDQTRALCEANKFILATDIADFYNQIYSHRVRNSIAGLGPSFVDIAKDVESVIHSLSSQSSKGVPTGPNASIIFSEAILLDVDGLLMSRGVAFCRFADDFRIFADREADLRKISEFLSEYLFDHHRLHLSAAKTYISETSEFLQREFFNHYRIEVQEAFDLLGSMTYGGVASYVDAEEDEESERIPFGVLVATEDVSPEKGLAQIVDQVAKTIEKTGRADLNLLKALLRRCRITNSDAFFPLLEDSTEVFLPVFHDLMKTMRQLYAQGHRETVVSFLKGIYESNVINLKFIRFWADWLASQDRLLLESSGALPLIRANGDLRHQANMAVVTRDFAWVRSFRANVDQLGDWDRRAVVGASRILSKDERGPFLANVRKRANSNVVDKLLFDHVMSH
jgi:hypothetical protein